MEINDDEKQKQREQELDDEWNFVYNHPRNDENGSFKYIEKKEEFRFAKPLVQSLFRHGDWAQSKNAVMRIVNVFDLKTYSGSVNFYAVLYLCRIHCGLGTDPDKALQPMRSRNISVLFTASC